MLATAQNKTAKFNQVLADSLKSMVTVDQVAANVRRVNTGNYHQKNGSILKMRF